MSDRPQPDHVTSDRIEKRVELDHPAAQLHHSASDPEGTLGCHRRARIHEPGLAGPSPSLNKDDRADPGPDLVEAGADGGELLAAATQRRSPSTSYHRDLTSGVYVRPVGASRP